VSRPIHLHPTAPIAPRVLLPGDPGRALMLAQELLTEPKMANHHRGLWGYTGMAADGEPLTIQSTGMGGPSAAIVLEELCDLGVERAIRVGTCGALDLGLALGDLVAATEALAGDGTSRALGAGDRVTADAGLVAALTEGVSVAGLVASADLYYGRNGLEDDFSDAGALASDLETAALFAVGARRRIAVASVLVVVAAAGADARLEGEDLEPAAKRAGHVAQKALVSTSG
jgi:uridine phosphorylase